MEAGVFPTLSVMLQYRHKNHITGPEHFVTNDGTSVVLNSGSQTPPTGNTGFSPSLGRPDRRRKQSQNVTESMGSVPVPVYMSLSARTCLCVLTAHLVVFVFISPCHPLICLIPPRVFFSYSLLSFFFFFFRVIKFTE